MVDSMTLICPTCGFEHQAIAASDQFVCPACQNEFLIDRTGDELSLHPVTTQLANVNQEHDARKTKQAIANTKRSITRLKNNIKHARSYTGPSGLVIILGMAGVPIVIGLVSIYNFILLDIKSLRDIENMCVCGMGPLIGATFFLYMSSLQRDAEKEKLREFEAQLTEKQQELAEQQNLLSSPEGANPGSDKHA